LVSSKRLADPVNREKRIGKGRGRNLTAKKERGRDEKKGER